MDRRFLALVAAAFVMAFLVFWIGFAPKAPAPAPVPQTASPPARAPAADQPSASSADPLPPPPRYQPAQDPNVVHKLG